MTAAIILLKQLLTMACYIAVGMIVFRVGIIKERGLKELTDLLLYLISPMLMFVCFDLEYSKDNLIHFFLGIGISFVILMVGMFISNLARIKGKKNTIPVDRFGIIYSNCGFMGIPLALNLLGTVGGFYISAYNVMFNLMAWTQGLLILGHEGIPKNSRGVLKLLAKPVIIMIGIALVMFVCRLHFPGPIEDAVFSIGNLTTPVAMILCGCYLAKHNLVKCFTNLRIWYVVALRLIAVPLAILVILYFLKFDIGFSTAMMIAAATPCPATILFFNNDDPERLERAMDLFIVSTIASIMTVPVIVGFATTVL